MCIHTRKRGAGTSSHTDLWCVSQCHPPSPATKGKRSSAHQQGQYMASDDSGSKAPPYMGETNPTPTVQPQGLPSRREKCHYISSFPGCGLFSGHCANNSCRESSRPQGRAAGGGAWQSGKVTHSEADRLGSEHKWERSSSKGECQEHLVHCVYASNSQAQCHHCVLQMY